MKKCLFTTLLFAVFFLPIHLFAQDITGLWRGRIYDDTVKKYIPYEIVVSEDKGKLTGYSYAMIIQTDTGDEVSMRSIKIKKKADNKYQIEDDGIVSNTYHVAPSNKVKKEFDLTLTIKDSLMYLSGTWTTNFTNKFYSVGGNVELKRKNDYWHYDPLIQRLNTMKLTDNLSFVKNEKNPEAVIAPAPKPVEPSKPQPQPVVSKPVVLPPAAEVAERQTSTIKTISFTSDSLSLTIYDNGEVDGDTVSILLGNKLIFSKQGLSTQPATRVIATKDLADSTTLIWYAENLGSIPPNTGLLILYDGDKRYEIFFSADLHTNAAVLLRRQKPGEEN